MAAEADIEKGNGSGPNPMEQFEVKKIFDIDLFGYDASFTNSSLYMVLGVVLTSVFMLYAMREKSMIPGRLQSIAELTYNFIYDMVLSAIGPKGMAYFPFVLTLFLFIFSMNMLGMFTLPLGHLSFTVTSQIIVTFAIALAIFIGVTLVGIKNHGIGFLKLFVPSGVPTLLLPLIVVIEVISYLSRPISLSVRLFANMMVGHTLLKVLGGFVAALGLAGIGPLLLMIPFTGLEILVAFLQAFVFAVLTCIYLNDAINMHH